MADIKDLDLYGLLELTIDSTEQEIRTAYRKKALKCHPDKNPDDKKAAETFHLLSKVIEVLLDKSARAAYDSVIRRKEEVKIRNSKLDSTRKKFKEDLERREKEAENDRYNSYKMKKSEEEILQQEIERLRKEGSIRLQEEIKLMEQEMNEAREQNKLNTKINPENYRLRIKWKSKSTNSANSEYNQDNLNKIFSKYGPINILVISTKKQGSALLEFVNVDSARRAKLYELGLPGNPLKLTFLNPEIEMTEAHNYVKNPVVSDFNPDFNATTDFNATKFESNSNSDSKSDEKSSMFPSSESSPMFNLFPSASKPSTVFPSPNSSNLFPSAGKPNNLFPSSSNESNSTNRSSLFPGACESSNVFSSVKPSGNIFPSGLFPSANVSSGFPSRNLVLSSKKSSQDIDYEEAVLTQMRKAQEKQL